MSRAINYDVNASDLSRAISPAKLRTCKPEVYLLKRLERPRRIR